MTLFDQVQQRMQAWLSRLDGERDFASQLVAREGHQPHLDAWLDSLNAERVKHLALMAQLSILGLENHPALLLPSRPKGMLKATLRPLAAVKKQA